MAAKDRIHDAVKNALIKDGWDLAVNQDIYDQFFQKMAMQLILKTYQVLLLIVDLNTEEVRQWIN
jgi:hypothetical protein